MNRFCEPVRLAKTSRHPIISEATAERAGKSSRRFATSFGYNKTTLEINAMNTHTLIRSAMERFGSPITIKDFMQGCQSGLWQQQVEAVRNSGDIEKTKKMLPAIVPGLSVAPGTSVTARRGEGRQSGYLILDYDKVFEPAKYAELWDKLAASPHIAGVCRSAGGNGIFAVLVYETDFVMQNEDGSAKESWNFNTTLAALRESGIIPEGFDPHCNDLPRLRFVSYDPNAFYRDVEPVKLNITERRYIKPRCRKETIEYDVSIVK